MGLLALGLAGCGEEDEADPRRGYAGSHPRARGRAQSLQGHLPRPVQADPAPRERQLVIRAEFALAQDPLLSKQVAKETLNRIGRSVYYALTELCKGRDPSFEPGRLAVKAVSEGRYLAARNRPG